MIIESARFRVEQRKLLLRLLATRGLAWIAGPGVIVLAFIVWGIVESDVRYMICGMMCLFIAIPMIMIFLYLSFAFSPDVAFNILPHRLLLTEKGILVKIYPKKEKTQKKDAKHEEDNIEGEENSEDEEYMVQERLIRYDLLGRYTVMTDGICFETGGSGRGLLYIVSSAFPNSLEMKRFIETLLELKRASQQKG